MRWMKNHKLEVALILVAMVALSFILEVLIFDNAVNDEAPCMPPMAYIMHYKALLRVEQTAVEMI